jgi:hypothetical protein
MDSAGLPDGLKKPVSYYEEAVVGNTNYYVESANYLKLRTLSLTYRMGPDQLGRLGPARLGMENLTLGLVGRNVFMITAFSGSDPENALNLATGVNSLGFAYPPTRNLTIEVSATF